MITKKCKCGCGKVVKGHPNKKFFSLKHKDRYHNRTNPRGYFRHLNPDNITPESIEDSMHPFDGYSLGQD